MGAAHRVPPPMGEQTYFGYPVSVWAKWMKFMNYKPKPTSKGAGRTAQEAAELNQLKADNPDLWVAFVTAQRINGERID